MVYFIESCSTGVSPSNLLKRLHRIECDCEKPVPYSLHLARSRIHHKQRSLIGWMLCFIRSISSIISSSTKTFYLCVSTMIYVYFLISRKLLWHFCNLEPGRHDPRSLYIFRQPTCSANTVGVINSSRTIGRS